MNLKMKEKEIFFWKNKREVDFILKEKNNLSAVNVCFSQTLPQREIDGLLEVKERLKNIKELILITKDIQKEENGIKFIPLWKWLSV